MKVALSGFRFPIGFLALFILSGGVIYAQTSAFTYQGHLTEGLTPANGNYDLEVRLFDAASGGNQVGATRNFEDVAVTNGVFSVSIDFGAAVFPGADRWLDVRVRPGASSGAFTLLAPRQPITATPYAIQSQSATDASKLAGVAADQYVVATDPRVAAELSTSSGFMISGANIVGFCSEGACRNVNFLGVTPSTTPQCGADGCMISGANQALYCNKNTCLTPSVLGAAGSGSTVSCGGDGCVIPGANVAVYCRAGSCQSVLLNGISASATSSRCGNDGCMVPGDQNIVYCSKGVCRTEQDNGITSSSPVVCGRRGCMAPGNAQALYCFQGSCQLLPVLGVTGTSVAATFVD
jgi:hypothetical protein